MRKAFKIIGVLSLLLVLAVAGGAFYLWRGVRAAPSFYAAAPLTGEERLRTIESVERKFLNFQSDLDAAYARAQARQTESAPPGGGDAGDVGPAEPSAIDPADTAEGGQGVPIRFTGPELDTYFRKWLEESGYADRVARYMRNPRIGVQDGKLILAGQMPDFDAIVSFHFLPTVDETGVASLALEGVYAGRLPLPAAAFESFRGKVVSALEANEPELREEAEIDEKGIANGEAIRLSMQSQLLQMMDGADVDGLVVFPALLGRGRVPAVVSEMEVDGDELSLGVELLGPTERAELLKRLKAPTPDDTGWEVMQGE